MEFYSISSVENLRLENDSRWRWQKWLKIYFLNLCTQHKTRYAQPKFYCLTHALNILSVLDLSLSRSRLLLKNLYCEIIGRIAWSYPIHMHLSSFENRLIPLPCEWARTKNSFVQLCGFAIAILRWCKLRYVHENCYLHSTSKLSNSERFSGWGKLKKNYVKSLRILN